MGLLHRLKIYLANRNFETKRKYLIKQGCKIGEGTRFISDVSIGGTEPYLITVGKDCLISSNVNLFTHDGGVKVLNSLSYFKQRHDKIGPITIGDNCFIGHGAIILPNVTIGSNVIIGAGSIVCKDLPSNAVYAGVPAKKICSIEEYYQKNTTSFFPTATLSHNQKKSLLEKEFSKETNQS